MMKKSKSAIARSSTSSSNGDSTWFPTRERCPSCGGLDRLEPVSIDRDVYHFCAACNYSAGVDDATDDRSLAAMIVATSLDESGRPRADLVRVRVDECRRCGNDDANRFRIVGCDEAAGRLTVECTSCEQEMTVTVAAAAGDDDGNGGYDNVDSADSGYGSTENWRVDDGDEIRRRDGFGVWNGERYDDDYDDGDEGDWKGSLEEDSASRRYTSRTVGTILAEKRSSVSAAAAVDEFYHQSAAAAAGEVTSLTCRCGNENADLFGTQVDPSTGRLLIAQCLLCEHYAIYDNPVSTSFAAATRSASPEAMPYVECSHCGNASDDRFQKIFDGGASTADRRLMSIKCLACGKYSDFDERRHHRGSSGRLTDDDGSRRRRRSWRSAVAIGRERIADLGRLRRGDHVAWHKWYAVWHHAIVVEADADRRRLTVIHNSGALKPLDGKIASVRLETIDVDPGREDLYRVVYSPGPGGDGDDGCFEPDEVVERAGSRLGQPYNPFTNNCEHFAKWCKTGRKKSEQVGTFVDRVASAGKAALAKEASGAPMDIARLVRAGAAAGGRVRAGPVVGGLVASIAVEGATFARDAKEAYRKYRAGEISATDFRQQLAKTGCECVGGLALSTGLGIVGQLVIPLPFIGGFIGCTLGNLVGRWCGAMVGKQLVDVKE